MESVNGCFFLSAILFGIGMTGFLIRRNLILMLVSVEIMLNAVNLTFVGFSRHFQNLDGTIFAIFVIAVAAAEVAIGLGILIALQRKKPSAHIEDLTSLKW